jgi:ribosome-binding factor A
LRREISDPRLVSLVISEVTVVDDLSVANIKVRLLSPETTPEQRREVMWQLARAAARLRRAVGAGLRLRRVPELRFSYDMGPDATARVEDLLAEIAREPKGEG